MTTTAAAPATTTNVPPGPRLPRAAVAALFILAREPTMSRLHRRYGDTFTVEVPIFGRSVIVSHPELVKQVFQAKPDVLAFGERSPLGDVLGSGSLFAMDGDRHLSERRLILPAFHGERMKSYESIIEQEAARELATWPEGEEFPTLEPFMRITLNSILRAVFGAAGDDVTELAELLPGFVTIASRLSLLPAFRRDLGPGSPGRRFHRYRARYDAIINRMIDASRADPRLEQRTDVMSMLLRAHYDDGSSMSRTAIADELLTLLAAGHETTATSLAWTVERLRRHPKVLARLAAEARDGDERSYRTATILETQRARPVITATGRHVLQPFELGPWTVPVDYHVIVSAARIHGDPRFFARPKAFEPERFLEQKPDGYTWIPFGGGTRRCPGAAFAHMEMDVVLRTLLRTFALQPTGERGERWRDRGVAYAPARGGRAIVRRLEPPSRSPISAPATVANTARASVSP